MRAADEGGGAVIRGEAGAPITPEAIDATLKRFEISLVQWVQILSCWPVEERVFFALRLLTVERGEKSIRITQGDLAALVCNARESVTRAMTKLLQTKRLARSSDKRVLYWGMAGEARS